MNLRKGISFVLVLCMALQLASCGRKISDNEELRESAESTADESQTSDDSEAKAAVVTTRADLEVKAETVVYTEYSKTYEAETGTISGNAAIASTREGYAGEGYVTGLDTSNDSWELTFELPDTQYYDITLCIASDKAVRNTLAVNGEAAGDFVTTGSGGFETVTFENVCIEKGYAKVSIIVGGGGIDIDYCKVEASKDISDLSLELTEYSLVNKNADEKTQAVYNYLCQTFGKSILLGQHDTVGTLTETSKIYEFTGKYPAIRFGDMMPFTEDMITGENEIEYATQWAEDGGLVGYMWHWTDPMGSGEYYAENTDFDLTRAVPDMAVSQLSLDELKELQKEGKVSEECVAIVEDIDKVSEKLKELQDAGITVIWRPLHEASNGYFWWGKDADAYKWLWKLLYNRMTNYHKLNNLIWVWSAQNASWYVGDDYCDILSVDIYDQGNLSAQVNRLLFLYKISSKKPIAMAECGNFPSIQNAADDKAMWSYIGQWGGSFLLNDDGTLNEDYNTLDNLIEFYSNNLTITRDELPDFDMLAESIFASKQADESSGADDTSKTDSTSDSSDKSDSSVESKDE